jgi:diacylglycerol kinase (ATP)
MGALREKLKNIRPSWRAIQTLWHDEYSFRALAVCGAATLLLSWALRISLFEFVIVVLTIGAVLAVEALNTALEELCDHVTPEEHPHIGKVKDLGSGAALLAIAAAFIVGLIIFIPHLAALL